MRMAIVPIILAGGEGARLAPLSTPDCPKPFIPFGRDHSLYARTLARTATPDFLPPLVVGQFAHRHALNNHARDAGVVPHTVLLEHAPHNTALAVALSVAHFASAPNTLLLILPADHWLSDVAAWRQSLRDLAHAVQCAPYPVLGLMGVVPNQENAGYGYVRTRGEQAPLAVEAFIEKPAHAARLKAQEGWFWNAGMCVGTQAHLQYFLQTHAPEIWQAAQPMLAHATLHGDGLMLSPPPAHLAKQSFDVAVLEKIASSCLLQPVPCDWADLGTPEQWCVHSGDDWQTACALPVRVDRPWGYFFAHEITAARVSKTLHVYAGRRLSMQRHTHRDEHWHVLSGVATVTLNGSTTQHAPGDDVQVPAGAWHRLANETSVMLVIEETQTGVPDDADIERAEDDFGRI
jgi:mannose-1-phosphate guanylyltransferase